METENLEDNISNNPTTFIEDDADSNNCTTFH